MEIEISIDKDGFVLLRCYLCGEYFKLQADDIKSESNINIWCPYCGLNGKSYFSEEVLDIALKKAKNAMNDMIYSAFKDIERKNKHNGFISFKVEKRTTQEVINPIKVKVDKLEQKNYKCCNKQAKIKPLSIECGSYCPICGGIEYE